MSFFNYGNYSLSHAQTVSTVNDPIEPDSSTEPYETAYQALKDTWEQVSDADKALLSDAFKAELKAKLQALKEKIDALKQAISSGAPQETVAQLQAAVETLKQSATAWVQGDAQTISLEKRIESARFLAAVSYEELQAAWDQLSADDKALLGDGFKTFIEGKLSGLNEKLLELKQALDGAATPEDMEALQQQITTLQSSLEVLINGNNLSVGLTKRLELIREVMSHKGDLEAADYATLMKQLVDPNKMATEQEWSQAVEKALETHVAIVTQNVARSVAENEIQANESATKNKSSSAMNRVREIWAQRVDALFQSEVSKDEEEEALSKINDNIKQVYEEGYWRPKTSYEQSVEEAKKRLP